jgi:hypothetical protein
VVLPHPRPAIDVVFRTALPAYGSVADVAFTADGVAEGTVTLFIMTILAWNDTGSAAVRLFEAVAGDDRMNATGYLAVFLAAVLCLIGTILPKICTANTTCIMFVAHCMIIILSESLRCSLYNIQSPSLRSLIHCRTINVKLVRSWDGHGDKIHCH